MAAWRNRHFLLGDFLLLPFALYLAFALRLDKIYLREYWYGFGLGALLLLAIVPALFYLCGIYKRYWRYASVEELALLGSALVAGTVLLAIGFRVVNAVAFANALIMPRSIPPIFLALALPLVAGPRLAARLLVALAATRRGQAGREPVLVVGAGQAGTMTVRELRRNRQLGLDVVGFLDDDPAKRGMWIAGVPVLGDRRALPELAAGRAVARAIIAMPTAPGEVYRETVDLCQRAGVRAQTLPGLYELLDGTVSVRQLRDVQIEDLLRREPIRTDLAAVGDLLRGKRVLITGAGGSIGGELARQVLRCRPRELVLLGHGENSIFEIHQELARLLAEGGGEGTVALHPVIADVRSRERLRAVFAAHRPEIVFHAAAHKHVPLMEANPVEAVTNNILGTRNALAAAREAGVARFVLVSSDKAVNPTSVMGASKRIAELLVHRAAAETGRDYLVTRFGNVLGSRGSVVLTMRRQIAAGGPVTVTHPEMRRYFMTIPEAVQLVLQAAALGLGGEVLVFDMGDPVRIADLAADLIRLSGADRRGVEIVYTGVRPGEKLHEELFLAGEPYGRTRHERIFSAPDAGRLVPADFDTGLAVLERAAGRGDGVAIVRELGVLLPEARLTPPGAAPDGAERGGVAPQRDVASRPASLEAAS